MKKRSKKCKILNCFIEKFDGPMLLGKLSKGALSEQVRVLLRSFSKMTKEGVDVSIGADAFESSKSAGDNERYCRDIDELKMFSVLGQLASSDRASETSNGDAQGVVQYDIMMSDS